MRRYGAQTDWQAAAGGKMAFDVASVRPKHGSFYAAIFSARRR